jgi:hypothetical protein
MKKIDPGEAVNTIANLGVIAGLVFVGLQLKQDRDVAERNVLFSATEARFQWAELVREGSGVWNKGLAGEELTVEERTEFDTLASSWELAHYTYYRAQELAFLDPSRFVREWALELHTHPGLLGWWRRFQERMNYTDPVSDSPWHLAVDDELQRLGQRGTASK